MCPYLSLYVSYYSTSSHEIQAAFSTGDSSLKEQTNCVNASLMFTRVQNARLIPVISGPVANLELKGRASRVVVLRLHTFIHCVQAGMVLLSFVQSQLRKVVSPSP
jgi:hypothetical protein